MKHFFIICLLFSQFNFAQNIDQSKAIVEEVVNAVNAASIDGIKTYLASDFKMAGQEGPIAKLVLKQLLAQLQDSIIEYNFLSTTKENNQLILNYSLQYKNLGQKEGVFTFNSANKITEMSLLSMEVKTMSGDTKVKKSDRDVIEVPFEMARKLILVDVVLNGSKRKFILDTGSPKVVLNSKYLNKDQNETRLSSSKGVNGTISGMDIETVKQLDFAGIQLNNQEVVSMDLSHLEKEFGMEFYGLIGYDLIKDYDLLLDYSTHTLSLISSDYFEDYLKTELKASSYKTSAFKMMGHLPVVDFKIGENLYQVAIDSGAETNLFDVQYSSQLEPFLMDMKQTQTIGADGQVKTSSKASLSSCKIGEFIIDDTILTLADVSHFNKAYGINIDGIIGFPILSRQKTIVSYSKNKIFLLKD